MHLKISRIEKVETRYGHDLHISMVTLYDNKGKYIKHVKLDDHLINILLDSKIVVNPKMFDGDTIPVSHLLHDK